MKEDPVVVISTFPNSQQCFCGTVAGYSYIRQRPANALDTPLNLRPSSSDAGTL